MTPEDRAEKEREADRRDAEAVRRFFGHLLGGQLKPSCARLGATRAQKPKPKGRNRKK